MGLPVAFQIILKLENIIYKKLFLFLEIMYSSNKSFYLCKSVIHMLKHKREFMRRTCYNLG